MTDNLIISRSELRLLLERQREVMLDEFEQMLARALEKAQIKSGLASPVITQAEAFRRYGRSKVERWVAMGKLHPIAAGKGNRKGYSVEQLQKLAKYSTLPRVM